MRLSNLGLSLGVHMCLCSLSIFGLPMISPLSLFAVMWIAFISIMDMTYTAYWVRDKSRD